MVQTTEWKTCNNIITDNDFTTTLTDLTLMSHELCLLLSFISDVSYPVSILVS